MVCPKCGSKGRRIRLDANNPLPKEFFKNGRVVEEISPAYSCKKCGHKWGTIELRLSKSSTMHNVKQENHSGIARTCPKCGSKGLRILYGTPYYPVPKDSVMGGCCVSKDSPDFRCSKCGYQWKL